MKYYRLSITIPGDKLAIITDLLNAEGRDMEMREVQVTKPTRNYTPAKPVEGDRMSNMLKLLAPEKGKTLSIADMMGMAEKAGYNRNSYSSIASEFSRSNPPRLQALGRGKGWKVL